MCAFARIAQKDYSSEADGYGDEGPQRDAFVEEDPEYQRYENGLDKEQRGGKAYVHVSVGLEQQYG